MHDCCRIQLEDKQLAGRRLGAVDDNKLKLEALRDRSQRLAVAKREADLAASRRERCSSAWNRSHTPTVRGGSGASPCSQKIMRPLGLSTRRIWPSAAITGGTPGSPTPVGFSAEGMMCTSTAGMSLMRRAR